MPSEQSIQTAFSLFYQLISPFGRTVYAYATKLVSPCECADDYFFVEKWDGVGAVQTNGVFLCHTFDKVLPHPLPRIRDFIQPVYYRLIIRQTKSVVYFG